MAGIKNFRMWVGIQVYIRPRIRRESCFDKIGIIRLSLQRCSDLNTTDRLYLTKRLPGQYYYLPNRNYKPLLKNKVEEIGV